MLAGDPQRTPPPDGARVRVRSGCHQGESRCHARRVLGIIKDMNENAPSTEGSPMTNTPMALRRTPDGKMIAGVCSGLQRQFGWDANILRLIWAVATFITGGTAAIFYAIAWVLIPEEGRETSIAQDLINKNTHR